MRVTFSKKGEKGNRKGLPKGIFQNKVSSGKANGRIMLLEGISYPVSTYLLWNINFYTALK
jgi:hypothetical protein